jgi:capsular polysaccharide biosynthesis protein
VKFLFTTFQSQETEGYLRVGAELRKLGHDASHVVFSRLGARHVRAAGFTADCLPDVMAEVGVTDDPAAEAARIERTYDLPSLRSVWITDIACRGRSEAWCIDWTIRHFRAFERIFDTHRPDYLVPDIGSETMRTAVHHVALKRGVPTFFLFYTLFPEPLRLYVDTPQAPIFEPDEIVELDDDQRAKVERFIADFRGRARPIVKDRHIAVTPGKLGDFARHIAVSATVERDNPYLTPTRYVRHAVLQRARRRLAPRLYTHPDPARKFVYFPLHVTDDFKVKRMTPHCVDQASLLEQVADWLPQGYDVVVKEHPRDVGRNELSFLRRVAARPNVRLVEPTISSHELIQNAEAIVVIGSTVGIEALLYDKPVLTLGQPWYAGYGLTVDVDSFRLLPQALGEVLEFTPDREQVLRFLHAAWSRCYPGAPAGYDPSPENARTLAQTLARAVSSDLAELSAPRGGSR